MSKQRNSGVVIDPHTPLRRSLRLQRYTIEHDKGSNKQCGGSGSRLRSSPRLNGEVAAATPNNPIKSCCKSTATVLRRSPRFPDNQDALKNNRGCNEEIGVGVNSRRRRKSSAGSAVDETEGSRLIIVSGLKALGKARKKTDEEVIIRVCRKRKRGDEGNRVCKIQGWSKEQEIALQRAYYTVKPTPHFWKKVAKLVPGKSAQECFDKVHADHITPPQHPPRSRAKKIQFSPVAQFSLSASKLLKPSVLKTGRSSCSRKKKSHLGQKNVRQLLQKKCHVDPDYEADLFSVLEPNINCSSQVDKQTDLVSPPKHLQEKQSFLQKYLDSSSGRKKPLSRFSSSGGTPLVSPPVLKQVKNMALHEKYIDQLHCREAKRKAALARKERVNSGKENRTEIHGLNMDVVKAAKNALVTDAQIAITQFQQLRADTMSNSSDTDGYGFDGNDDEGDIEI